MRSLLIACAGATIMWAPLTCAAQAQLPEVRTSGQVEYITGGIGSDESSAIESASKSWPLTMEFAVKDGKRSDFAASVDVNLRDIKGNVVLATTATGPFLLAKVAPGKYSVAATLAGKTLRQSVVVKPNLPAKSIFVWPAGTDKDPIVNPDERPST